MSEKRKPDWHLCYKPKDAPRGTRAVKFGAAWNNDFGGINITIDKGARFPDTALNWVALYPNDEEAAARRSGEQGHYPKGHPLNIRRGESTQAYLERRRSMFSSGRSVEVDEFEAKQRRQSPPPNNQPSPQPEEDYMERRRRERQAESGTATTPPTPPDDDEGPAFLR